MITFLLISSVTFHWTWSARPDAEALSLCQDEMKAIAAARSDSVSAQTYPAGVRLPAIVIKDTAANAPNDFMFPGDNVPGDPLPGTHAKSSLHTPGINTLTVDSQKYQAIVGATLIVASECFNDATLHVGGGGDWNTEWAAARALYTEVTHRQISHPISSATALPDEDEEDTPLTASLMGLVPMALAFMWMMSRGQGTRGMSWGSYYLIWLLAPMAIAWFTRFPWLLVAVPVAIVGRKWLPDPYLFLRRFSRMSRLRTTITANPHDVKSAMDLAGLYLEQRRPQRALPLLDRVLERDPEIAELVHYKGVCLLALGRYDDAYKSFAAAATLQPKLRYGEPYLRGADALLGLKKPKDAIPLLERFVQLNHSSIEGLYKLSRAHEKIGDHGSAKESRKKARALYRELPSFARKSQLKWWFRSWLW